MNPSDVTPSTELLAALMRAGIANRQNLTAVVDRHYPSHAKFDSCHDALLNMALHEVNQSADYLTRLILATDPDLAPGRIEAAEKYHCPPRAVVVDGMAYLAIPDENLDGIRPDYREHENDNQNIMRLVTMPASSITDLGGVAPDDARKCEPVDLPTVPLDFHKRN